MRQRIARAVRPLTRDAGFVATAVASLALAVGANTAVFSLVNALWLRPLPIGQPERVAVLYDRPAWAAGELLPSTSWRSARRLEGLSTLKGVTYQVLPATPLLSWMAPRVVLHGHRELETAAVAHNYFDVLGVPIRGRSFAPDEDLEDWGTAIVSDSVARGLFGSTEVVSRRIESTAGPLTIVGVTPPGFGGPRLGDRIDIWVPFGTIPRFAKVPTHMFEMLPVATFVRLADGVTWGDVDRRAVARTGSRGHLQPLTEVRFLARADATLTDQRTLSLVLWVTMLLVLLAGLANLVGSVFARMERRAHEFTVRVALGATGRSLATLLCWDLALVCLLGFPLALLIASSVTHVLGRYHLPGGIPVAALHADFDWRVFVFLAAMMICAFVAAAAAPCAVLFRNSGFSALSTTRGTGSPGAVRLRRLLLGVHVGLSVVLLAGAASLVRMVVALTEGTQGLSLDRTIAISIRPSMAEYLSGPNPGLARRTHDFVAYLDQLRSLAGTDIVTYGAPPFPLPGTVQVPTVVLDGQSFETDCLVLPAGPNYIASLGGRILAGADLGRHELAAPPSAPGAPEPEPMVGFPAALIEVSLARRISPDRSPVGRILQVAGRRYRIGGVFADVLEALPARLNMGVVAVGSAIPERLGRRLPTVLLKTTERGTIDPGTLENLAHATFPGSPEIEVASLSELITRELGPEHIGAMLFGWFGITTVILGAIGIHGLIAFIVSRTQRELAIHLALGANRRTLVQRLSNTALRPVAYGVLLGTGCSLAMWRAIDARSLSLDGLGVLDHAVAATLLVSAALVASGLAAAGLRKISVTDILRSE